MTAEKAIEILSDVGDINRCCAEDAEALDMAIEALERASCIKEKCVYCPHCEHCDVDDETLAIKALEPSKDCISRAEAIKETKTLLRGNYDPEYIIKTLKMLPSVTPDVLDKIRERISLEKIGYPPSAEYYKAIVKVLQIIDKYKTETKIEQGLNFADQDTMMSAT